MASIIVPLVMAGSIALIGLLAFVNVRQRKSEIGILRAIGLTTGIGVLVSLLLAPTALILLAPRATQGEET